MSKKIKNKEGNQIKKPEAREASKVQRRKETDMIKEFIEYAETQGHVSRGNNNYYMHFTKLANRVLLAWNSTKPTPDHLRDRVEVIHLGMFIVLEKFIEEQIKEELSNNPTHKEDYHKIFSRIRDKAVNVSEAMGARKYLPKWE